MGKFPKEKMWQAIVCLTCSAVLWVRLHEDRASEFGGGWLTGPLLKMAELGFLFFLTAFVLGFFLRRISATIALAATLLCFPFYLYTLMPGAYRWIFSGEYSVPESRSFHWDIGAFAGVCSLLSVSILSVRNYSNLSGSIK
jgi:hypothetical protein